MNVALRFALGRHSEVALATIATVGAAIVVALVAAVAEAPDRGIHAAAAWPFALTGLFQPGLGQLLVTLAVREAGASRTSVVFGIAPLLSVAIAVVFLGEPLRPALAIGALLIVAGGVELARERDRPGHLRAIGLLYAFGVVVLFAIRDNLLRRLSEGTQAPPAVAAAAALLAGGVVIVAVLGTRLRGRPQLRELAPFLGAGALFGLSYVSLFEAFYRGRVTIVSPLVATESLWGVALSALVLRHTELVGRRLALGAVLVVAGGALIGIVR